MARIVRLTPISSTQVGPGSTVLPDGTILNPVPYEAVNTWFDDGVWAQVERPLTLAKVRAAYLAAQTGPSALIDGIATGLVIP